MERESALLAMLVAMDGIHGNLESVRMMGLLGAVMIGRSFVWPRSSVGLYLVESVARLLT
jgi:hypothetical protein